MVFSHFEVLHILIRSEFHLQLPLNIIYKFFLLSEAPCVFLFLFLNYDYLFVILRVKFLFIIFHRYIGF